MSEDLKNYFFIDRNIFPLIEKANRNEKTGSESLINGYGFAINEGYDSENPGRLKEITISQNPPSGGERPFEETGILPGGCYPPEKVPSLPETTTLNDFTYYPDGNISGYSETIMDGPHGNLNRVSDIKYDDNGKIVGMVMAYAFGAIDNNGSPSIVTRNIKYNNFGDRVYWEEILYNNYPPKPPVVKKETTLTCEITQIDSGRPGVRRIGGKLFALEPIFRGGRPEGIVKLELAGKKIVIVIDSIGSNGLEQAALLTADTDVTGYYWVDFDTKNIPGEYKVTAQFNGDNEYLASSAQAGFAIRSVKMETALTCEVAFGLQPGMAGIPENEYYQVTGKLIEIQPYTLKVLKVYPTPPAKGVADKLIKIKIILSNGWELYGGYKNLREQYYEVRTDKLGYYSFSGGFYNMDGTDLQVSVVFDGDEKYGPSKFGWPQYFISPVFTPENTMPYKPYIKTYDMVEPEIVGSLETQQTISAGVIVNEQKEEPFAETHKDWFWFKK